MNSQVTVEAVLSMAEERQLAHQPMSGPAWKWHAITMWFIYDALMIV